MRGHCYKIHRGQKHSAGRTISNFPPKSGTPCRVRVRPSKLTPFRPTSQTAFGGCSTGCIAAHPPASSTRWLSLLAALVMLCEQSAWRFMLRSLISCSGGKARGARWRASARILIICSSRLGSVSPGLLATALLLRSYFPPNTCKPSIRLMFQIRRKYIH